MPKKKHVFKGSLNELKEIVSSMEGEWDEGNDQQIQFRAKDGGILNYYPSTGTLLFQGPASERDQLEHHVIMMFEQLKKETTECSANNKEYNEPRKKIDEYIELHEEAFTSSELIIGLVGAVGTNLERVRESIHQRLISFNYQIENIHVSTDIIQELENNEPIDQSNYYIRTDSLMNAGNDLRRKSKRNDVLALGIAAKINEMRSDDEDVDKHRQRTAYIINSLKHPDEVVKLREIYTEGFYLIGIYTDQKIRMDFLIKDKQIAEDEAEKIISRDDNEELDYGQKTRDTFFMSDYFVRYDNNKENQMKYQIWRFLDLLFGYPYHTPTFDEYAMFLAFASSLRSSDLSRQVGAVIARDKEIISTGTNEVPSYGGGQYWPIVNNDEITDEENGRDYKKGYDSNQIVKLELIEDIAQTICDLTDYSLNKEKIINAIKRSNLKDITEYGRAVHAEMEAILACGRKGISLLNTTLYCTTFPCHNCAKHIVGSGIERVVYVEPYPKSKALNLHDDTITISFFDNQEKKVNFEPFVGLGPRRFFDFFSMTLSSGRAIYRKKEGKTIKWEKNYAVLRKQMFPKSYLEHEEEATEILNRIIGLG